MTHQRTLTAAHWGVYEVEAAGVESEVAEVPVVSETVAEVLAREGVDDQAGEAAAADIGDIHNRPCRVHQGRDLDNLEVAGRRSETLRYGGELRRRQRATA